MGLVQDLWIWKYVLEAGRGLNARTTRTQYEGALIRLGPGFGCLHPWPELGDGSLTECLDDLSHGSTKPLVQRSLECAAADGLARLEKRSLFEGLTVPQSHATLPFFDDEMVEQAVGRGFTHLKVKAGREVAKEFATVRRMIKQWPEVRWRLDFNGSGKREELEAIFSEWSDEEKAKIDFLEDPVDYRRADWKGLQKVIGVPFANDRWMKFDQDDSEFLVAKPAVQKIPVQSRRVVVTSYLDHPLGQTFAAWEAARAGVTEVCGLQTHGVFQATSFTEVLGPVQPEFHIPEGCGLGFDDLLEALPWRKLE